jgi:hypothetical protein
LPPWLLGQPLRLVELLRPLCLHRLRLPLGDRSNLPFKASLLSVPSLVWPLLLLGLKCLDRYALPWVLPLPLRHNQRLPRR